MIAEGGTIEEPERGAWVADVESRAAYDGALDFGGVTWTGRLVSSAVENGRYRMRIAGGAGDLGAVLPDKWYLGGGSGNAIVGDIGAAIGMQASPDLPQRVASWQRARSSAGEALDRLCDALGAQWWVARDGVLHAGVRDGGALADATVVDTGSDGIVTLAADTLAGVTPGRTLPSGVVIRHARHIQQGAELRSEVSTVPLRIREPSGLGYLRVHRGVVESQHADGSLDLIVDGTHSLTRVAWLPGAPMACVLEPGDVVSVASWAGGDPRQWYATGMSRVANLAPIAGVGDSVDCGMLLVGVAPPVPPGTGTLTDIRYVAPAPASTFATRLAAALLTLPPPFIVTQIPMSGLITSGNDRILAGTGDPG
jgi:hypothetical protein